MFASLGTGAYLQDVDGNNYLDFIAGLAAIGLGYGEPRVAEAVAQAARWGGTFSLPTRLEAQVAERLCEYIGQPWAQQVRWVKTGSEATEAAVRIARAATGRARILTVRSGYHSWHSWFQAVKPQHPGVPEVLETLVNGIEYGQPLDGVQFTQCAAVILEPAPITGGGDGAWLAALNEKARAHGCLVIFDEIVWGFRLARAGGSEFFSVQPDLACYGKALGNGTPIACVVGERDLMQHAALVSGTFGGDTLGLAAANEVLRIYGDGSPVQAMWERGDQLVSGLREAGWGAYVSGYHVHPIVRLDTYGDAPGEAELRMSVFLQSCADQGVLWHPGGANIMACMREDDIGRAVGVLSAALATATAGDMADLRLTLRGAPYRQAFARAR